MLIRLVLSLYYNNKTMKQIQSILNANKIFVSLYSDISTNLIEVISVKKFEHITRIIQTLKQNGLNISIKKITKINQKYSVIFQLKVA